MSTGSITNAYYDAAITRSQPGVGINDGTADIVALGGAGDPSATEASSYVGFNFTTIWTIAPGELPTLINVP